MSKGGLYIDFKKNSWCVSEDMATFSAWEDGRITTEEAIKRIKRTNALRRLTEEDFLKEAEWLGYRRDD